MYQQVRLNAFFDEMEKIAAAEERLLYPTLSNEQYEMLKQAGLLSTVGKGFRTAGNAVAQAGRSAGQAVAQAGRTVGQTAQRAGTAVAQGARREYNALGASMGHAMANARPAPLNPLMPVHGLRESFQGVGHYLGSKMPHVAAESIEGALHGATHPIAAGLRPAVAHPVGHAVEHGLAHAGHVGAMAGPIIGPLIGEAAGYLSSHGLGRAVSSAAPALTGHFGNVVHAVVA